ncbi:MAG TPA: amidohydrolase family protein [Bacteroidia bacterium]|nr:amidohydrolase family protein [Bacteroidia bacterium]
MMRKITADRILLPTGCFVSGQMLLFDDTGKLLDITEDSGSEDVERFNGIIIPGFINTHCHLELSYLKNAIPRGTTLPGFIRDFSKQRREAPEEQIENAAINAAGEMWNQGIQGAGDICNRANTVNIKKGSPIRWHNFIEVFGLDESKSAELFDAANALCEQFILSGLAASVVPHAPYSVPPALFNLIASHHPTHAPWSIHSQESNAENRLFRQGEGKFAEVFAEMGINTNALPLLTTDAFGYCLSHVPSNGNLLFVHNTVATKEDLELISKNGLLNRSWMALCPKANQYIEGRLPDIPMLMDSGIRLTIGTDSLASNNSLNMLDELKTIHSEYPKINGADMLTWATRNGAQYFGWSDLGSFTKGNAPGCVLIETDQCDEISQWQNTMRII